jgi:DNA-binding IclR family transcriptional regulator
MDGDRRDRDTKGAYTETYPDIAFIDAITSGELSTTSDVATRVGCVRETARRKLNDLERQGRVSHREVGDTYIWEVR